jgi:hypothetical protein
MKNRLFLAALILCSRAFSVMSDSEVVEQLKSVNVENLELLLNEGDSTWMEGYEQLKTYSKTSLSSLLDNVDDPFKHVEVLNLRGIDLSDLNEKWVYLGIYRAKNVKHLDISCCRLCDAGNDPFIKKKWNELGVPDEDADPKFIADLELENKVIETTWSALNNSIEDMENLISLNISSNILYVCWLFFMNFLTSCRKLERLDISDNDIFEVCRSRLMLFPLELKKMTTRFLNISDNKLNKVDDALWNDFISELAKVESLETIKFLNDKEEKFSKNKMEILKKSGFVPTDKYGVWKRLRTLKDFCRDFLKDCDV